MITLYLDMDGVLADFNKEYAKVPPKKEDRKKFRSTVLDHKIFEKLDFMPEAEELLNYVAKLKNINVEILTSMGSFNVEQGAAAMRQKRKWLNNKGIPYKANFVKTKTEKAQYATPKAILIDDSIGCISPFIRGGGHGIHHSDINTTLNSLDILLSHLNRS